jgi:hypothetical protein
MLSGGFIPWAKCSIESRLAQLVKASVPTSFVYGSNSFAYHRDFIGNKLTKVVPKLQAQVAISLPPVFPPPAFPPSCLPLSFSNSCKLLVVHGAGHHLFLEKPKDFNFIVISALLYHQESDSFLGLNNQLNIAYQKFCKHQKAKSQKRQSGDSDHEKEKKEEKEGNGKGKEKEKEHKDKDKEKDKEKEVKEKEPKEKGKEHKTSDKGKEKEESVSN